MEVHNRPPAAAPTSSRAAHAAPHTTRYSCTAPPYRHCTAHAPPPHARAPRKQEQVSTPGSKKFHGRRRLAEGEKIFSTDSSSSRRAETKGGKPAPQLTRRDADRRPRRSTPKISNWLKSPDRCRTGYPTPGATGGPGAAGPLLASGVPEGGRWCRSNQPWRGYASAREWTTTA